MSGYAYSYADISQMLGDRVDQLAPHLLGAARRTPCGRHWECGGLDGRPGGKSWQLKVNRGGGRYAPGSWADFASGETGDALDLVGAALFQKDLGRAYAWALDWLGLEGGQQMSPAERRAMEDRRAADTAKRLQEAAAHEESTKQKARALWLSGSDELEGSPADRYLLGRGIDVRRMAPRPRALRFSWRVWCQEARTEMPALLAAVARPGAGMVGCHRTYLQKGAGNEWRKADLAEPKKSLGRVRGGLISLSRGASLKPLARMTVPEPCALGEGIEDTLSAAIAQPDMRCCCVISLGNLGELDAGYRFSEVIWLGQNDPPGSDARLAEDRALAKLAAAGRRVRLARPPEGIKDWNDWLVQIARQGEAA